MESITPVFVFSSLNTNRGGMTKAVMRRANAMTAYYKDVQILTLQFQRNHREIIQRVRASGQLSNDVIVKSLFAELDPFKKQQPSKKLKASSSIEEKGLTVIKDNKENGYHYYRDGVYIKFKKLDSRGRVVFVDYFNEGLQRTHREEYDEKDYLVRIKEMDILKNKPCLHRYFSKNGTCFLTTWINPETEKIERSQLFYPKPLEFKDEVELYTYWVNQEINAISNPVLMSDSRGLPSDHVLLNIPSDKAAKVAILHNNHFKKPYRKNSGYSPAWSTLLDNLGRFDRIVFLTEEQREDFIEDFGDFNNYCVIPHEAKKLEDHNDQIEPEPHLAVALVRLKEQKRIDEAIRAFVYVVQKVPDARFEIYGSGPLKDEIQSLINELGMEDHIKLMGYTQDPISCYKKGACMVLSSDFEGSPLVFNESLAAGTPVVTFDCKYGPRDVIRDGVDGFIVPRGNLVALAEKIVTIMENPELRRDMSKRAKEITRRYSYKRYTKNWVNLFQEIGSSKANKKDSLLLNFFKWAELSLNKGLIKP